MGCVWGHEKRCYRSQFKIIMNSNLNFPLIPVLLWDNQLVTANWNQRKQFGTHSGSNLKTYSNRWDRFATVLLSKTHKHQLVPIKTSWNPHWIIGMFSWDFIPPNQGFSYSRAGLNQGFSVFPVQKNKKKVFADCLLGPKNIYGKHETPHITL